MTRYPIELNLNGRNVLVVGLGQVGRRKALAMADAGAHVIGVDPAPESLDEGLLVRLDLRREPYRADHFREVALALAIAAGPAEINRLVVADARSAGVWVCSASDPEEGDFTVPAVWRSGPLVLSVSTSGSSPALAAALRDRAAKALGLAPAGLALVLSELRPIVMQRVSDENVRHRIFREWADPEWLDAWLEHGADEVRRRLLVQIDAASRNS